MRMEWFGKFSFLLSEKIFNLRFWTCIYFFRLSDRVFHSDHDGSLEKISASLKTGFLAV